MKSIGKLKSDINQKNYETISNYRIKKEKYLKSLKIISVVIILGIVLSVVGALALRFNTLIDPNLLLFGWLAFVTIWIITVGGLYTYLKTKFYKMETMEAITRYIYRQ